MINQSKPTGDTFINQTRPTSAVTWESISTTWATETRTWDGCASVISNFTKPFIYGAPVTTSYLSPGTLSNETYYYSGKGGVQFPGDGSWTTPSNASASDNTYTTYSTGTVISPNYLKAVNFGFAIPSDANVVGIEVQIEKSDASATAQDFIVKLVQNGEIVGNNKAKPETWGAEASYTYGSSSDLWGVVFSAGEINSAAFGVVISADPNGSAVMRIDHIKIAVTYEPVEDPGIINLAKPS